MSFLSKLFGVNKKNNGYIDRARALHGQIIKYVTERHDGNDDVIGRGGSLCLHGEDFIVDSSGDRLFVCNVRNIEINFLMSGDGAVIKGPDSLRNGELRTITVHFVYYRK